MKKNKKKALKKTVKRLKRVIKATARKPKPDPNRPISAAEIAEAFRTLDKNVFVPLSFVVARIKAVRSKNG